MFNYHLVLHVVKEPVSAEQNYVAFLYSERCCLGRFWAAATVKLHSTHLSVRHKQHLLI